MFIGFRQNLGSQRARYSLLWTKPSRQQIRPPTSHNLCASSPPAMDQTINNRIGPSQNLEVVDWPISKPGGRYYVYPITSSHPCSSLLQAVLEIPFLRCCKDESFDSDWLWSKSWAIRDTTAAYRLMAAAVIIESTFKGKHRNPILSTSSLVSAVVEYH